MAITDNKIINGSGLSELSSQIKSYVNGKIVNEVYVGDTAPTDPKAKLWVDTSAEPSNNSYTKSEIDTKLTQKQDTLTPGDNITIINGVISSTASGSAEPDAYIKDASVSGNTLTLTKKDDTEVVFTPSGGSSGGGGSEWIYTTDKTESGLYNAKELVIFTLQTSQKKFYCDHYIFVKQDGTQGTLGADFSNQYFGMFFSNSALWQYNGSTLEVYNYSYNWLAFAYKT